MTIVAGFIYSQGMLLCSDMEEGDGYSKKQVKKILHVDGNGWQLDIGGSGPSAVLALAYKKLKKEFFSYDCVEELAAGHEESIRSVLLEMHERYIWPSKSTDYTTELLIGLNLKSSKQCLLYRTQEYIPQPVETFCCIGKGSILGNYFASTLYDPSVTRTQMMFLGTFIIREVKDFVPDCGQGTQMEFTMTSGKHFSVPYLIPREMETNELPYSHEIKDWFRDSLPPFEYDDRWFDAWNKDEDPPDDIRFTEVWKEQEKFPHLKDVKQSVSEKSEPEP